MQHYLKGILAALCLLAGAPQVQAQVPKTNPCVLISGTICDGVTSTNPLPITGTITPGPASVSATARGSAIVTGGTAQTLVAANTSRKAIVIENPCSSTTQGIATAESIFINFTSAASVSSSANAAEIAPCSQYALGLNGGVVTPELISIIAATTGHIIYAKEF